MLDNNMQYYQFTYLKETVVSSGSKIIFSGEFFDSSGNRQYKYNYPCIFKYMQGDKYYIEVDGKLCWCKDFKKKIERFAILNGKKIPNPCTEEDVKAGQFFLIFVMVISSVFKGNVLLWIIELAYYFIWVNHKKYD